MKPTILPLALAVMIAAGMCGCDNSQFENTLSRGDDVVIEGCTYMVYRTYAGLCVPVHKGNCTNHAPVVVTNGVDQYVLDAMKEKAKFDSDVRWIQGWQDGAEAIRQCYSNDFQNGYAIGYLRGQIECASNTVYVTNAVEVEK